VAEELFLIVCRESVEKRKIASEYPCPEVRHTLTAQSLTLSVCKKTQDHTRFCITYLNAA